MQFEVRGKRGKPRFPHLHDHDDVDERERVGKVKIGAKHFAQLAFFQSDAPPRRLSSEPWSLGCCNSYSIVDLFSGFLFIKM